MDGGGTGTDVPAKVRWEAAEVVAVSLLAAAATLAASGTLQGATLNLGPPPD